MGLGSKHCRSLCRILLGIANRTLRSTRVRGSRFPLVLINCRFAAEDVKLVLESLLRFLCIAAYVKGLRVRLVHINVAALLELLTELFCVLELLTLRDIVRIQQSYLEQIKVHLGVHVCKLSIQEVGKGILLRLLLLFGVGNLRLLD